MNSSILVLAAINLGFQMSASVPGASVQECVALKTEPSLDLLGHMANDGLSLEKPREVTHLFLGSEKSLKAVRETLISDGYVFPESEPGQLLVAIKTPVSDEWVRSTMARMCQAAADAGAEYDGWDIDVAADQIQRDPR